MRISKKARREAEELVTQLMKSSINQPVLSSTSSFVHKTEPEENSSSSFSNDSYYGEYTQDDQISENELSLEMQISKESHEKAEQLVQSLMSSSVDQSVISSNFKTQQPKSENFSSPSSYNLNPATPNKCNCKCDQILRKLDTMKMEILEKVTELRDLFGEIKGEMSKMGIQANSSENNIFKGITLPFTTMDELLSFEEDIKNDPKKFLELQNVLTLKTNDEPIKFIRGNLKMIFTDTLAKEFTWVGARLKKTARTLYIILAIKKVFLENFEGVTEKDFNTLCMRYFQYANDRLLKKVKYQNQIKCNVKK